MLTGLRPSIHLWFPCDGTSSLVNDFVNRNGLRPRPLRGKASPSAPILKCLRRIYQPCSCLLVVLKSKWDHNKMQQQATMRKLILIKCVDRPSARHQIPHKDKLAALFTHLILSFQIGSNLVALHLSLRPPLSLKKSAMNLWYVKQDRELNSRIRLLFKIQGVSNCMKSILMQYGVSSIQSSFSLIMADRNNWQTQLFSLRAILNTNLYTLGFGLTSCPLIKLNKLSLERICDPLTIMIRALFVST